MVYRLSDDTKPRRTVKEKSLAMMSLNSFRFQDLKMAEGLYGWLKQRAGRGRQGRGTPWSKGSVRERQMKVLLEAIDANTSGAGAADAEQGPRSRQQRKALALLERVIEEMVSAAADLCTNIERLLVLIDEDHSNELDRKELCDGFNNIGISFSHREASLLVEVLGDGTTLNVFKFHALIEKYSPGAAGPLTLRATARNIATLLRVQSMLQGTHTCAQIRTDRRGRASGRASGRTDAHTGGRMGGRTDGQTDGPTE